MNTLEKRELVRVEALDALAELAREATDATDMVSRRIQSSRKDKA